MRMQRYSTRPCRCKKSAQLVHSFCVRCPPGVSSLKLSAYCTLWRNTLIVILKRSACIVKNNLHHHLCHTLTAGSKNTYGHEKCQLLRQTFLMPISVRSRCCSPKAFSCVPHGQRAGCVQAHYTYAYTAYYAVYQAF